MRGALVVRRQDRIGLWFGVCAIPVYFLSVLLFRRKWAGENHVPRSGGVILVANHVSPVDPIMFARFVWDAGRAPRFLAKESLFRIAILGRALRGAGQIPVFRGSMQAKSSLDAARDSLARGNCVIVYPEGTITHDPQWWPMLGKTGIARLALTTDVPVVPVAQWGAQQTYNRHQKKISLFPRKSVQCLAGPALDLSEYRGKPLTADVLRSVTDLAMGTVRGLLAQIRQEQPPEHFYRPRRVDPQAGAPDDAGSQA